MRPVMSLYRGIHPTIRFAKLKYAETISLDPGTGATSIASYSFRANDLYDPNYTGTGHQPLYFDNLMQLYGRFCVMYSRIRVSFFNNKVNTIYYNGTSPTEVNPSGYRACIDVDEETSDFNSYSFTNMQEEANTRYLKWKYIPPQYSQSYKSLSMSCNPAKVLSRNAWSSSELFGTASASPTRPLFYNIFLGNVNDSDNPPALTCQVVITYYARFFDRVLDHNQN